MDELDTALVDLEARAAKKLADVLACWREPADLSRYLAGDVPPAPVPGLLRRDDTQGLIYAGKVNELHGEPESAKGFAAGALEAEVLADGGAVVHLDFDVDPGAVAVRALAGGASAAWLERLYVFTITEPLTTSGRELTDASRDILAELVSRPGVRLAVVDGLNRAVEMHDLDPNSDRDISWLYRSLVLPLRVGAGTALVVDHVVKDRQTRNRWAAGSQQKLAALDGVSFEVRVKDQPAPGRIGRVELVVAKDRAGGVRRIAHRNGSRDVAAVLEVDGTNDEPTVRVLTPQPWHGPTFLMERISRWLEEQDEPQTTNAIDHAVTGRGEYKRQALDRLVADGFVRRTERGQAQLHASEKPYREAG